MPASGLAAAGSSHGSYSAVATVTGGPASSKLSA
eukprot:CAMPEP_0174834626 /NCGR_PEP_ID=MMETSP1114-20130205/4945_1 /TAXON_ID=312471 /ORGANISM="Neobodo designis, Strain CCAP 1951/1" /LENGTH=33 /DNA_ID= /DNA_START= /DNA_END= /DNA_ORIENTATION=